MKKISVLIIALAMLVVITGVVMADTGVPAVPEKQLISTATVADVDGTVMETDATAMTLTNNPNVLHGNIHVPAAWGIVVPGTPAFTLFQQTITQLNSLGGSLTWHIAVPADPFPGSVVIDSVFIPDSALNVPIVGWWAVFGTWGNALAFGAAIPGTTTTHVTQGIHPGMLSADQVQYSTTYDLNIVNQAGATSMQKTNAINTNNMLTGQKNLDMPLSLTFIATADGGNSHGTENIMLDGAATAQTTANVMLCPFGPSVIGPVIPPFCNIIQAGGAWDLTVGSVTTAASNKFIGTDATSPVVLNYEINVKPYGTSQGQIPAMGSASAYYKAHIQEGRTASNTVSEDLTSSESTSVNGMISGFSKKISYQSGPKLL